jgi:hypothetical protein
MSMFENLCSIEEADFIPTPTSVEAFTSDKKATPAEILDGKLGSANWLESLGLDADEDALVSEAQQTAAREAFAAITAPLDTDTQKTALAKIEVPQAVKHLVGMLTAYDWAFVDQAKQLRGYCVAQLLEESKHPDAKYRLRAIELLGKVTEVGLFTERLEIKKTELSDEDLEKEIKARMEKYMDLIRVVENVENVEEMPS